MKTYILIYYLLTTGPHATAVMSQTDGNYTQAECHRVGDNLKATFTDKWTSIKFFCAPNFKT